MIDQLIGMIKIFLLLIFKKLKTIKIKRVKLHLNSIGWESSHKDNMNLLRK